MLDQYPHVASLQYRIAPDSGKSYAPTATSDGSRCVRRAWLWGVDEYAGRDYSHRKDWVLERLRELASVFAIDICAYAVLTLRSRDELRSNAIMAVRWYLFVQKNKRALRSAGRGGGVAVSLLKFSADAKNTAGGFLHRLRFLVTVPSLVRQR